MASVSGVSVYVFSSAGLSAMYMYTLGALVLVYINNVSVLPFTMYVLNVKDV